MAPKPDDYLSTMDQHILLATIRLNPDAYGLAIQKELALRIGRELSVGTIYAALERLESNNFITSREGPPIEKRGGRRKLFFEITGLGRKVLSRSLFEVDSLRNGVLVREAGL